MKRRTEWEQEGWASKESYDAYLKKEGKTILARCMGKTKRMSPREIKELQMLGFVVERVKEKATSPEVA